ncbi:MAG: dephospho-CoA kinase [Oscillospiraceae bacterium]|nr:dephospho-CoA kinase [Oscillospiraceae bacterium]
MPKIIGLTGPSGAGKSLLSKYMGRLGPRVIRADDIYGNLLAKNREMVQEIATAFPNAFGDVGIDRSVLAKTVFDDPEKLRILNCITHKYIIREIQLEIDRLSEGDVLVIEAIYLLESGISTLCDLTVAMVAPASERMQRVMTRDGVTKAQAESRFKNQNTDDFYTRHCDIIIENTNSEVELEKQAVKILEVI